MERFLAYLDRAAEQSRLETEKLRAADRADEADLTKIKTNVYGICRTVFQAVGQAKYREKLSELQETWTAALAAARQYGDTERAVVEEVKLQALKDCMEKYREYGGK